MLSILYDEEYSLKLKHWISGYKDVQKVSEPLILVMDI